MQSPPAGQARPAAPPPGDGSRVGQRERQPLAVEAGPGRTDCGPDRTSKGMDERPGGKGRPAARRQAERGRDEGGRAERRAASQYCAELTCNVGEEDLAQGGELLLGGHVGAAENVVLGPHLPAGNTVRQIRQSCNDRKIKMPMSSCHYRDQPNTEELGRSFPETASRLSSTPIPGPQTNRFTVTQLRRLSKRLEGATALEVACDGTYRAARIRPTASSKLCCLSRV